MNIILVSGAPRAGKDTVGKMLGASLASGRHLVVNMKLAKVLREIATALGCPTDDEKKEEPIPHLNGYTTRQVMQSASEEWLVKVFGPDVMGRILARQIAKYNRQNTSDLRSFAIVTDSGFLRETPPLMEHDVLLPNEGVVNVHVERDGKTYHGDTRSDWNEDGRVFPRLVVRNDDSDHAPEAVWRADLQDTIDVSVIPWIYKTLEIT